MKKLGIKKNNSTFTVPSVFVDRYMANADECAVKVYLYLLRHISDDNLTVAGVGQALSKTSSEIEVALKYWDEHKVIKFIDSESDCSIEFLTLVPYENPTISIKEDLSEKTLQKNTDLPEHPKYLVKDINASLEANKDVRDMFFITEQLLGKTLNQNEMKIMYSLYDWLKIPTDVIVMLLEHCTSMKKMDLRYIEKVAITWAENGIDNFEKANVYIKSQAKLARMEKKVKRIVQISGRDLTELETKFIRMWLEEYKATESNIKKAYEITVMNTGKMNFKYMDAVLKNIINDKGATKKESPKKKTNFVNYTGDDNLSEFEKKVIAKRLSGENKQIGV